MSAPKKPDEGATVDNEALLARLKELEEENARLKEPATDNEPKLEPEPDPDEEYVMITLFYDGDKYKDDVYVSVNGENCLIRRGQPVKIKRKFVSVLDQSDKQDRYTLSLINQFQEEYREAVRSMA